MTIIFSKYDNRSDLMCKYDNQNYLSIAIVGRSFICDGESFEVIAHEEDITFQNVRRIIEDKAGSNLLPDYDGLWRYDGNTFVNYVLIRNEAALL